MYQHTLPPGSTAPASAFTVNRFSDHFWKYGGLDSADSLSSLHQILHKGSHCQLLCCPLLHGKLQKVWSMTQLGSFRGLSMTSNTEREASVKNMEFLSCPFSTSPGQPSPLGPSAVETGVNFALYTKHATDVTLCLSLTSDKKKPMIEILLNPLTNKTGDVWHVCVENLPLNNIVYGYRVDGPQGWESGHRFDKTLVLIDPYAKLVEGRRVFGDTSQKVAKFLGTFDFTQQFDWGNDDSRPRIPEKDLIIYEMNVRAFTADESSKLAGDLRGTYLGVIEKIPHLVELGINAVELLPVFEYDEFEFQRRPNPRDHMKKGKEELSLRYYGPFQITEQINDISFRLRLPDTWKIHNVFHVNLWKTFGDVPDDGEPDEQPEVEANEEILVPEQVLAHKVTKKGKARRRFLIEFKNFPAFDAKWMEEEDLAYTPQILKLYLEAFGIYCIPYECGTAGVLRLSSSRPSMVCCRCPEVNTWGYSTINFFSPMSRFASGGGGPIAASTEFKMMVKAFHQAGIEVILDVVYNHTNEADDQFPYSTSFRGIDNLTYYMVDTTSFVQLRNYSGCGNTLDCNHPVVTELVLDSLKHCLLLPTSEGGLGIIDPQLQSRAFLTKLIVRGLLPSDEAWKILLHFLMVNVFRTSRVKDRHVEPSYAIYVY
ncbi:hypothetical protein L7F22_043190 [Adiantum nelumboides]|nr:hypothetical protein [Adiantum nelumboides]